MLKILWKHMHLYLEGVQETSAPFLFAVPSETLLDPLRPACQAKPLLFPHHLMPTLVS